MQGYKNIKPAKGGKVHKVVQIDYYNEEIETPSLEDRRSKLIYGYPGRKCEPWHEPGRLDQPWWREWVETDELITCGNCLKSYFPDGRKRPGGGTR